MSDDTKGKQVERQASITVAKSVTLPLSFANSFWTPDYRSGYETLYNQLDASAIQSEEIIAAIRNRAAAERTFAANLHPSALRPDGFGIDEGASLKMGLEALLSSAVQESRAHLQLADELLRSIAEPFSEWSEAHRGRIRSSRAIIEGHLTAYERKHAEVLRLKTQYDEACRTADATEDELSFLNGRSSQSSISSPRSPPPTVSAATPPPPPAKVQSAKSGDSEDGLGDDDDDKTLIGRSGATGGSITAALGRAFTVRRTQLVGGGADPASPGKELPSMPLLEDPNVGAALDWSKSAFNSFIEKVAGPQTGEGRNEKARKDAEATEERYKAAVEALDLLRLSLEEALSEHFSYSNRCESDRVKAATSVLRSFHATVSSLPGRIAGSNEKVGAALALIRPERDVLAIVERLRTGPFQPRPTVYHSHYSEPAIHTFGLDLRKFDETNTSTDKVPPILTFLLNHISARYPDLPDAEQRKAWLYETPLVAQHHLRSALNNPNQLDSTIVAKFDLPVVASVTKLWLLELDVPVIIYSHYDEYRALYPKRVGAEIVEVPSKIIADHVARLPPVHLEVLRTLIGHFSKLVASTKTEESDEVFLQKLALSFARCILRPKQETSLTHDDRFPSLLFIDLIKNHDIIFHSADELKSKQREDRYKPRRQRTKPVDVRVSRSRLGADTDRGRDLLKEQRAGLASPPPPVPPLPLLAPIDPSAPPAQSTSGFAASPIDFGSSPAALAPPSSLPDPSVAIQPPTPIEVPVVPIPAASAPSPTSQEDDGPLEGYAPTRGTGSLTRREGVAAGARRGTRGPRPLPGSSTAAPAPSAPISSEEEDARARSASFTRTRAGHESAGE